ncbi:PEP/pyruvate-binding domain-containing protein [Nocardia altamirensis]|uniref:PEP/pyruvate-binding domain-containing protein n=1 Tax=Nocardia altamirensis TaxID=472158 RepID=UPI00084012C1|nr:PEP/pyruvate-binding domain-containing protein [Nocardia altamirensis]
MTGTEEAAYVAVSAAAHDLVVVLGGPRRYAQESLGGKGARLDELIRAGLPVPAAYCLTTGLFERFLRGSGLDSAGRDPGGMRDAILASEIPEDIAVAVLDAYAALGWPRVAVRSSAGREDSAAQSFAGQHDTVLDVCDGHALLEAVKVCWASLWSDRAVAYRADADAGAIAVVIQRMIPADVAGVLFTRDPISGRTDRFVVDACLGLGEGLVAGKVTADSFVVDPGSRDVVERTVRYKITKCAVVRPGVVELVKVAEAERAISSLTPAQLSELVELAVRVRDHYGAEQDIEWALCDGALHLLQARPITAGPVRAATVSPYAEPQPDAVQHGTLWSRMDIGEIFTGAMTPLGLSFAHHYQYHVHGACVRGAGVRDTGDPSVQMGYFQGYVYLNVSYASYLLSQSPAMRDQRDATERFASEEVDLASYRNPFGSYSIGPDGWRSALFWLRTAGAELRDMRKRTVRMVEARRYEYDRAGRIRLGELDRRELGIEMRRRLAHFHDMHVGYMPYFLYAFGYHDLLAQLCVAWLGDAGERLQNRLKTDMSNLRTVECAREVWQLAQVVRDQPRVLEIVRSGAPSDVSARLRADAAGSEFWAAHMEPFLRENGVHAHQEMELTNPRWIDDPTYVFQLIRRYVDDGCSIDDVLESVHDARDDEAAAAVRGLSWPKRRVLNGVIWLYKTCSSLRETARVSMIGSIWLVRSVVYEVADRLLETGVLRSVDEVAYLDFADILRYLAGEQDPREIFSRAALEEGKRISRNHGRMPAPPLSFLGEWDITRSVEPPPDGARLDGLGTSQGRAVGRVRILDDLAWQADEFQAGEILVTQYTDSTWTPLFAVAAGIVTDIGSMLSHSSIVSREFRVPAVVNTKYATRVLKTGDLVVVDGDRGVVEVIEPADPPGRG